MPTIEKDKILSAMTGKMRPKAIDAIADILCQGPSATVTVIDDEADEELEDGTLQFAQMTDSQQAAHTAHIRPMMLFLPSVMFESPWLQNNMKGKVGNAWKDLLCCDMRENPPVCEIFLLAAVLRETYGEQNLPAIVSSVILSQPAYAPFARDAMPFLQKCLY